MLYPEFQSGILQLFISTLQGVRNLQIYKLILCFSKARILQLVMYIHFTRMLRIFPKILQNNDISGILSSLYNIALCSYICQANKSTFYFKILNFEMHSISIYIYFHIENNLATRGQIYFEVSLSLLWHTLNPSRRIYI